MLNAFVEGPIIKVLEAIDFLYLYYSHIIITSDISERENTARNDKKIIF